MFIKPLFRICARIVQLVNDDAEFRSDFHVLVESARHALKEGDAISAPAEPALTPKEDRSDIVAEHEGAASEDTVTSQGNFIEAGPRRPPWTPTTDDDLPVVEERCRLKAEASRWAIARRADVSAGANLRNEIVPVDHGFLDRANRIGDCYLWMLRSTADSVLLENLGDCFAALADALSLVRLTLSSDDFFAKSRGLLAEAQSALRIAVERVNDRGDSDQAAAFAWLRLTAHARQIHISRYMRLDDEADPANSSDLLGRIQALATEVNNALQIARGRRQLFSKMHYLAGQLARDNGDRVQNWQAIVNAIGDLIATGVPPSNKETRETLLPIIETIPPLCDSPVGFRNVLRELSRQRAAGDRTQVTGASEVHQVRPLLKNKVVLLIGGAPPKSFPQQTRTRL